MNIILRYLKSDTIKTIVVLFIVNGVAGISEFISPELLALVNAGLLILAGYFRVNIKTGFRG